MKTKLEIEKPFTILQKVSECEIAVGEYRQWLYWNDWGLLFPVEIEKLFGEENIYLN